MNRRETKTTATREVRIAYARKPFGPLNPVWAESGMRTGTYAYRVTREGPLERTNNGETVLVDVYSTIPIDGLTVMGRTNTRPHSSEWALDDEALSYDDLLSAEDKTLLILHGMGEMRRPTGQAMMAMGHAKEDIDNVSWSPEGVTDVFWPDYEALWQFLTSECGASEARLKSLGWGQVIEVVKGKLQPAHGDPQDRTPAKRRRMSKTALIAAVGDFLKADPSATAEQIGRAVDRSPSRIRDVWAAAKEAARQADRSRPRGHMEIDDEGDTRSVAVDETVLCEYCESPIDPTWVCPICREGGGGLCPDCHNSKNGHPESEYVTPEDRPNRH